MQNLTSLRRHAISRSLFRPGALKGAINRLAFVQADPIRSPARAQDLILRQRVKGYRAGDLERRYPELDIEEDVLYAYGFLPRTVWQLLHPRKQAGLPAFAKKVLDVPTDGRAVPRIRTMDCDFGSARQFYPWDRLAIRGHNSFARSTA